MKQKCNITSKFSAITKENLEDGQQCNYEIKSDEEKSKRQKIFICWVALSVISLMSSIGSFLRAIGAVYQLIRHQIPKPCLFVTNEGLLYQSPLKDGCLRFIDFSIIFFNFLPLLIYSLAFIIYMAGNCYYKLCLLNFLQQPVQENSCAKYQRLQAQLLEQKTGGESKGNYQIIIQLPDNIEPVISLSRGNDQETKSLSAIGIIPK